MDADAARMHTDGWHDYMRADGNERHHCTVVLYGADAHTDVALFMD